MFFKTLLTICSECVLVSASRSFFAGILIDLTTVFTERFFLKLKKAFQKATNRDKHINEASKRAFANNPFKISRKYTQDMFSNGKICFNVFNIRTYDKLLCNLKNYVETV